VSEASEQARSEKPEGCSQTGRPGPREARSGADQRSQRGRPTIPRLGRAPPYRA
jgi:hypothetical protein